MLFLLRTIRRKLLKANKVTTYLFYAVGEIVLVVVGILIAVSIDDWNQKQLNLKKEQVFLSRIKEEAQWNIDILDSQIQEYRSTAKHLDSISYILLGDTTPSPALEVSAAPYFIGAWMIKTSVYTELVSSGSMGIISDVKLREMMDEAASMETIAVQALDYWRGMSLEYIGVFRPYLIRKVSSDSVDFMTLDLNQMKNDPQVIGSIQFWSNANAKFALGIDDFKGHYQRILGRVNCLETNSCTE